MIYTCTWSGGFPQNHSRACSIAHPPKPSTDKARLQKIAGSSNRRLPQKWRWGNFYQDAFKDSQFESNASWVKIPLNSFSAIAYSSLMQNSCSKWVDFRKQCWLWSLTFFCSTSIVGHFKLKRFTTTASWASIHTSIRLDYLAISRHLAWSV